MRASLTTTQREHNAPALCVIGNPRRYYASCGNLASAITKLSEDKGCVVEFILDAASKMG
jgi:hypothetical protein